MLIKELIFLGFQASTDEPGQPSISYKVIRRFVLSEGFECPFGLQLLANILSVRIQSSKTKEMTLEKKEDDSMNVSSRGFESEPEIKESDESNSTVLYNAENLNANIGDIETVDLNKKDFFSSESDSSTSSSNCGERRSENKRRKFSNDDNNEKTDATGQKEEKGLEGLDAEEKELEKLLRMAEVNPSRESEVPRNTSVSGEAAEKKKPNQDEVTLLDCLDQEDGEVEEKKPDVIKEEEKIDFFALVNREVKKMFLLSSDESYQTGEEAEDDEVEEKEKKNKKKRTKAESKEGKKNRKDDLSEFRVPNFDAEESEIEKNTQKEIGSSDESTGSVECVVHIKNRKRQPKSNAEETSGTESESDIQQIRIKTESSPTKGRRNIKKILKKDSLQVETKQALKMETERKKRVAEREKLFEELFPNSESKLILDFDPETKDELIVVDRGLSRQLKPHQRNGVRFMWNCCFESLKRLEEDNGSGCVLAHCMGLGKTLQVITLVHTLLTQNTGVRTVLVISPYNTIRNWMNEFRAWQTSCEKKIEPTDLSSYQSRHGRLMITRTWLREGGVMIVSYAMFRSLIKNDTKKHSFAKVFLDPGPDMVVCDEGHVLKNNQSLLSSCMSQMKTLRRIILTGTPLQNNLLEYYCMVQFVKPNILGTVKEFKNRFVNPINNGQFEDSTQWDVRLMKRRAHVLHTMLDGFVQRLGYYVLKPFLPEKQEYVISIALTDTQENVYQFFLKQYNENQRNLMKDFHWMQKVWTHPLALLWDLEKHKTDPDANNIWANYVRMEECDNIRGSGKLFLLFTILRRCKEIGDKVLVFSQSLLNLDLIEYFLRKANSQHEEGIQTPFADSWVLGVDYYRLDGSKNSETRDKYYQKFNDVTDERFRLFLVSTKAGGLGVSLVAANRVVVFDVSWNPSHDVQSIFRVYRFGQQKPCYIYRFLAAATMEEKIYRRQVTKLSLAHRILDEHQIERHYTMGNLQELYTYNPVPKSEWEVPKVPKDNLCAEILTVGRDFIVSYHEHDSLLENKEEEELTEEERRAAWEDFEKEKLTQEGPLFTNGPSNSSGVVVGDQVCRIVDVRTLNPQARSSEDVGRLLELGRSFGMLPYGEEDVEKFCRRIDATIQTIFPWGVPGQVVQGVANNVGQT